MSPTLIEALQILAITIFAAIAFTPIYLFLDYLSKPRSPEAGMTIWENIVWGWNYRKALRAKAKRQRNLK